MKNHLKFLSALLAHVASNLVFLVLLTRLHEESGWGGSAFPFVIGLVLTWISWFLGTTVMLCVIMSGCYELKSDK